MLSGCANTPRPVGEILAFAQAGRHQGTVQHTAGRCRIAAPLPHFPRLHTFCILLFQPMGKDVLSTFVDTSPPQTLGPPHGLLPPPCPWGQNLPVFAHFLCVHCHIGLLPGFSQPIWKIFCGGIDGGKASALWLRRHQEGRAGPVQTLTGYRSAQRLTPPLPSHNSTWST